MDDALLTEHIKWAEAADGPELFPYKDTVGKLTIGYGRNLDDRGITRAEAELMLQTDVAVVQREAESLPYWERLDPVRKIVVLDMIYNLGFSRFRGFRRFHTAMMKRDYQLAAHEMKDSRWYRQVLRRAKVLHKAMQTGLWK